MLRYPIHLEVPCHWQTFPAITRVAQTWEFLQLIFAENGWTLIKIVIVFGLWRKSIWYPVDPWCQFLQVDVYSNSFSCEVWSHNSFKAFKGDEELCFIDLLHQIKRWHIPRQWNSLLMLAEICKRFIESAVSKRMYFVIKALEYLPQCYWSVKTRWYLSQAKINTAHVRKRAHCFSRRVIFLAQPFLSFAVILLNSRVQVVLDVVWPKKEKKHSAARPTPRAKFEMFWMIAQGFSFW